MRLPEIVCRWGRIQKKERARSRAIRGPGPRRTGAIWACGFWKNEQVVLRADTQDPPTANIQYLFVIPYGGYYLGFATLHDEGGQFQIQLAWSADGLSWQRPSRLPWLDVGPAKSFDCGMVLGPADPIFWEKEMWFPYGGFPIRHDSKETNWESAIGIATMRTDGFAAWEAGAETGELVTQPFCCNGNRLFVLKLPVPRATTR